IERQTDGALAVAGLPPLPGVAQPAPGAPAVSLPAVSLLAVSLPAALPALVVSDATVTFIDRAVHGAPRTLALTKVAARVGPAAGAALPFTVAADLDPAGRVQAEGGLQRGADNALSGIDAQVKADGVDAHTVLGYLAALTPGGAVAVAEGGLVLAATIAGSLPDGLSGHVALTLPSGSVDWDGVRVTAPIAVQTAFAGAPGNPSLSDGKVQAAQLGGPRFTATQLDAAFAFAGNTLQLTAARASAYGGAWTQHGTVELANPPRFTIALQADGVDCNALLTAVTGQVPQFGCERFSAAAQVHGPWTGAARAVQDASGSGQLEMRGGTIPSSSIIAALWQALVPLVDVHAKPHDFGAPTRIERVSESFTLHGGRMDTTDLSVITDDYHVTGRGSVSLDGALALDTEVAMTPNGITKLLIMADLPVPAGGTSLPPIPTRITGTLADPTIIPEASQLPVAAVRVLFQGARGAGEVLKDAAGSGVKALREGFDRMW
ncbi:MAG: AsmA-like C-terminal region-containing protein, partial [Candidatus Binatia bacterium]